MDPTAALASLRELIAYVDANPVSEEHQQLADHLRELDDWLSRGGFLPHDWRKARSTSL